MISRILEASSFTQNLLTIQAKFGDESLVFWSIFFRTQLSLIIAPNIKNKNPVIFGVVPMFKATKNEHVFQKVEACISLFQAEHL